MDINNLTAKESVKVVLLLLLGSVICLVVFLGFSSSTGSSTGKNDNKSVIQSTSCDVSKISVGGCLITAGIDMSDRDFKPLSELLMNGAGTYSSHTENGKCFADVHVSGTYRGTSYNKKFSCPVN